MLQEKINLSFTSPKFRASEDLYKNVKLIFQQAIDQKLTLVENMSWQLSWLLKEWFSQCKLALFPNAWVRRYMKIQLINVDFERDDSPNSSV